MTIFLVSGTTEQDARKLCHCANSVVHLLPSLGAYITAFGSTESQLGLREARQLNAWICNQAEDDSWTLVYVRAAVRAWWTSEYSGWYLDDPMGSPVAGVDLDEGAFSFLLISLRPPR